jgi:hypothetical protein
VSKDFYPCKDLLVWRAKCWEELQLHAPAALEIVELCDTRMRLSRFSAAVEPTPGRRT